MTKDNLLKELFEKHYWCRNTIITTKQAATYMYRFRHGILPETIKAYILRETGHRKVSDESWEKIKT